LGNTSKKISKPDHHIFSVYVFGPMPENAKNIGIKWICFQQSELSLTLYQKWNFSNFYSVSNSVPKPSPLSSKKSNPTYLAGSMTLLNAMENR
jgi:hypothetical protein